MNLSIRQFLQQEDGITALEYGLLAAIVAGALVAVFGTSMKDFFSHLFTKLTSAVDGASSTSS